MSSDAKWAIPTPNQSPIDLLAVLGGLVALNVVTA